MKARLGITVKAFAFNANAPQESEAIRKGIESLVARLPAPAILDGARLWSTAFFSPRGMGVVVTEHCAKESSKQEILCGIGRSGAKWWSDV